MTLFQFLMVRLEDTLGVSRSLGSLSVSIPYGSIRSENAHVTIHTNNGVSIPYGSIRRAGCPSVSGVGVAFQFLMVRLEV